MELGAAQDHLAPSRSITRAEQVPPRQKTGRAFCWVLKCTEGHKILWFKCVNVVCISKLFVMDPSAGGFGG